jgi:Zn-dependent M28 family amino/carboxypeptidase
MMTTMRKACLLLLCCLPAASLARQAPFLDVVGQITAGADSAGRRLALTKLLDADNLPHDLEQFSFPNFAGANIVVNIPAIQPHGTLLIGAHYDRVGVGQGAVDNAASCAVLLRLLADVRSRPLTSFSVTGVFFDLEERGLVGSQAYFAAHQNAARPAAALNLDIFGYGDTFFVTASSETMPLLGALRQATSASTIHLREVSRSQYPASDHRIMMTAGLDTIGLALIDGSEIDSIIQPRDAPPRIMTIIHTPADTSEKIQPADVDRGFRVLEQAIRSADQMAVR